MEKYINIEIVGGNTTFVVWWSNFTLNPLEEEQGRTDEFNFLIAASSIVETKPFDFECNFALFLATFFPPQRKWLNFDDEFNLCMFQINFNLKAEIIDLKLEIR